MAKRALILLCTGAFLLAGCLTTREYGVHVRNDQVTALARQADPARWMALLGPALVEDLRWIGADKILVVLRKYDQSLSPLDVMLINKADGTAIWRLDRRKYPGDFYLLARQDGVLIFAAWHKGRTTLVVVEENDGRILWDRRFDAKFAGLITVSGARTCIIATVVGHTARLEALDTATRKPIWTHEFSTPDSSGFQNRLVQHGNDLVICAENIDMIDTATGQLVWRQKQTGIGKHPAPPFSAGNRLYFIDRANRLVQLDMSSGRIKHAFDLGADIFYSNIYPLGNKIYVRGVAADEAVNPADACVMMALNAATGKSAWELKTDKPILSNIVEDQGRVYAGTCQEILGLESDSGRILFKTSLTRLGDAYPVQVRKVGDKIVYISELTIAACDPLSGNKIYSHGITPIAHLNQLEARIKQIEGSGRSGRKQPIKWASYHSMQAALHQNLAGRAYVNWDVSDPGRSAAAEFEFAYHNQMARDQSLRAMTAAIEELGDAFADMVQSMADEAEIRYDRFLQRCILASYTGMSGEGTVYRPHRIENFLYLRFIDLRTGRKMDYPLSPVYETFGLWNMVDTRTGMIYHHGMGLDPGKYEFAEPCINLKMIYAKWYKSYLIALPFAAINLYGAP